MLTDAQRASIAVLAKELGVPPSELLQEAEEMVAEGKPPGDESSDEGGDDKAPPKAAEEKSDAPNGGRGFFAYQYPYLTVNEIRKSLGLSEIGDGGLYSLEWLPKHGGGPKPAADGDESGEAEA